MNILSYVAFYDGCLFLCCGSLVLANTAVTVNRCETEIKTHGLDNVTAVVGQSYLTDAPRVHVNKTRDFAHYNSLSIITVSY